MKRTISGDSVCSMIDPLFSLVTARFEIEFEAEERWQPAGSETAFRGRLGFSLKQKSCPFPDFRRRVCDECVLSGNCLYLILFSPVSALPEILPQGEIRFSRSPVRPFVFAVAGSGEQNVLEPGDTGMLELTLFGPGIQYSSLFLESAVSALQSFPLTVKRIRPLFPDKSAPEKPKSAAFALSEWITDDYPPETDLLTIRFVTPVRLVKDGHLRVEETSFTLLITSLIRRIRDLKRFFTSDMDMGQADDLFFETAKAVHVHENRLFWARKKRYSHRQGQDVYLNGFKGEISFGGPFQPFIPLLKAGEIVHVGKGTTSGGGKMRILDR